jgi:hypothetical protein
MLVHFFGVTGFDSYGSALQGVTVFITKYD